MRPNSVYHSFAVQHEDLNKEVVDRVRAAAPVQSLYLLGLTSAIRHTETLFSVQAELRKEVAHYYLLVLVEKGDDHSLNNLQDKIEGALQLYVPVTAIVFSGEQFAGWLAAGHPFAAAVAQNGFPLYRKEGCPLPLPAPVNKEAVQEGEHLFTQTKVRVREFLAGAELYTVRVQYKLAAFMLHQAVEQALRAMLIIHTGLRINTHSIDRLVRCCSMFCSDLPAILSRDTEKEKRLFQLLQKAYIDTRYGTDYSIKLDDLTTLTVKAKTVFSLFQSLRV